MSAIAGETLIQFFDRREKELESQISALRGELVPRETELAQIRTMRSLLRDARGAGLTDLASDAVIGPPVSAPEGSGVEVRVPTALLINGRAVNLTIKDMILRALRDHFPDGATPTDLRDYIKAAFDRDVDRNSISPQLARLREQGTVEQYGLESKWKLTRAGRWYGTAKGTIAGGAGLDD